MSIVDGVVGNSSSGLIEAPSLRIGTINIGDRQAGRIRAANVIDCEATKDDIHRALGILFSPRFRSRLIDIRNPYGMPGASKKIAATLATVSISGALKKRFFNVDFSCE